MEARPTATLTTPCSTSPTTRGRPRKVEAKSPAERTKAYRDRLKADGLKEVKCYIGAEHLAFLKVLRDLHGGTIADAVVLALTAVMRGELPALPPTESARQQSVILLP